MNSRDIARAIQGDGDLKKVISELGRSDPVGVADALRGLTTHDDPEVRSWIPWAAPRFLAPTEAASLIEPLLADRDSYIRTEAMDALITLDPKYVAQFVPTFIEAARNPDFRTATYGILRLTRFRAPQAVELFRDLSRNASHAVIRNHAEIMLMVLERRDAEIIERLRSDDTDWVHVWVKGAIYSGSRECLEALKEVAQLDPHEACRRYAAHALSASKNVRPLGVN